MSPAIASNANIATLTRISVRVTGGMDANMCVKYRPLPVDHLRRGEFWPGSDAVSVAGRKLIALEQEHPVVSGGGFQPRERRARHGAFQGLSIGADLHDQHAAL